METNTFNQPPIIKKGQSGLGIAGMIIGIISLLLSCFFIGGILGIVGLILSIIGVAQKNKKSGMAIAGIVLNVLAILIMIFMLMIASSSDEDTSTKNIETQATEHSIVAETPSSTNEPSATNETTDISDETSATISKEEFIASCEEIPYKTLARYPEENTGKHIVLTVQIAQILQGGWFDNNEYYRVYTDNDGYGFFYDDEYFMYDSRIDDNTKLLQDDIIKVYGEFVGTEAVTRALTGTTEYVPAFKAYYIDIDSLESNENYATLDKYNQIETDMSYEEVVEIIQNEGTLLSETSFMEQTTTIYMWYAQDGISNMTITFSDNKVIAKAQSGLN